MRKLLTQIDQKNLKKKSKCLLVFTAFILFIGNYHICNYFYPTNSEADVSGWWDLKANIYSLVICLLFTYCSIGKKGLRNIVFSVFAGLAVSDCIDRFFFDIRSFNVKDIVTIIITTAFAVYNNRKWLRKAIKTYY